MDITGAVNAQMQEEIGEQEGLSKEEVRMLCMKFGLLPVQLTPSEKHLIQKEERKNGR